MKMLLVLWLVLVCAGPAEAAPVLTALGGVIATVKTAIAGSVLLQFIARTALSMGLSALARALAPKPRQPGITTETTTSGGTTSQKFPLGIYATGGQLVAPPMSYGSAGKTPRAYLVYVIALSAAPGIALSRVIINDDYAALGAPGASWGRPVTGDLADHAWVDFRDGTQSAAHADLLAAFGSDPDRPWTSDMIGPGVAYAVCRFKYNRELFNGLPAVRFEVTGIPLYDPREDTTVGGSGPQRWDNPATWAPSDNPVVMIYNILRGITLPDGEVWGGECAAEDLPLANWFAGMNECDLPVDDGDEGSEPQYRAGFEVAIEDEPAAVIEELLKTCSGQIAEMGGVWTIRVGAPGLSVLTISDDDILRSREQELDPFPGLADTWNGITATYPEPESLWEAKEAPARHSTEWEAADGGRRRTADLQLPACPWATQVQRLMASYIADERRFRRHRLTLPPEAAILGPLDTLAWTSARNGYTTKLFEISGLTDSLMTMHQSIQIRERDADDFEVGPYLPAEPGQPGITRPVATSVPGWAVSPVILTDGAQDRRPALQIDWDPEGCEDATGIQWEVRLSGGTDAILTGTHGAISAGFLRIAEGVLAGTVYEVRARLIVDRPVNWTAWTAVAAPSVLYGLVDLNGDKRQVIALGPLSFSSSVLVTDTPPDTLTDLERAARFLYLQRTAFGANPSGYNFGVSPGRPGRFNLSRLEPMLEDLHSRLAGVIIECLDFGDFITRYDTSGTLFYLDPPYWGAENYYGKGLFSRHDFQRLADILTGIKGRFVMSINDVPEIRQIFGWARIEEVQTTYTIGSKGAKPAAELIIRGDAL